MIWEGAIQGGLVTVPPILEEKVFLTYRYNNQMAGTIPRPIYQYQSQNKVELPVEIFILMGS